MSENGRMIPVIKIEKKSQRFEISWKSVMDQCEWVYIWREKRWQHLLLSSIMFHLGTEQSNQCTDSQRAHLAVEISLKSKNNSHLHPSTGCALKCQVSSTVQKSACFLKKSRSPMATEGGVNEHQSPRWEIWSSVPIYSSRLVPQLQPQQAGWSRAAPPSAFSHFGSERRVLLSNSSVVVQDPLQVSHCFVAVFCLDLWTI